MFATGYLVEIRGKIVVFTFENNGRMVEATLPLQKAKRLIHEAEEKIERSEK